MCLAVVSAAASGVLYGLYNEQQTAVLRKALDRRKRLINSWYRDNGPRTRTSLAEAEKHLTQAKAVLDAEPDASAEDLPPDR